jgi:DNA-nicking Smr family endonuclease
MPARHPSREERALWRAATRDVAPLSPVSIAEAEVPAPPPPPVAAPPAAPALVPSSSKSVAPLPSPGVGLDRRSALRLKRGQLAIEARLDLHGMTQAEAHRALDEFLALADAAGQRCVLVITGKGGVLRAGVPRWINEQPNRSRVLAFTPAQPKDGGGGALYLLLRRRR